MDHLGLLGTEVLAMAAVLGTHDPDQPVGACPGWTLRELTGHLVGVHRWARAALDSDTPPAYDEPLITGDDLAGAYEQAAAELTYRLEELPPDHACWTFERANRTAGFWTRRQLHEVAVHRHDVAPYDLADDVALDGIDEVLTFFAPRQVSTGRTTLPDRRLVVAAGGRQWTLGRGEAADAVSGSPAEVLLRLWGRGEPLPDGWTALTP